MFYFTCNHGLRLGPQGRTTWNCANHPPKATSDDTAERK